MSTPPARSRHARHVPVRATCPTSTVKPCSAARRSAAPSRMPGSTDDTSPQVRAHDVQVRVLGHVVDRRALAEVGVPDQARAARAAPGSGTRSRCRVPARRGRPPRAGGRRSTPGWRAPARSPRRAPAAAARSGAGHGPGAARRAAPPALPRARAPCAEPMPGVRQAGGRDGSACGGGLAGRRSGGRPGGRAGGDGLRPGTRPRGRRLRVGGGPRRRDAAPRPRTSTGSARRPRLLDLPDPGDDAWRALVRAVLAGWPADVEGVCRLFLTRGLGEGMPPTALALLSPVPAE